MNQPSTGMDPEARRHMWEVIASVSQSRSVVLTTHSMEVRCARVYYDNFGYYFYELRTLCVYNSDHL